MTYLEDIIEDHDEREDIERQWKWAQDFMEPGKWNSDPIANLFMIMVSSMVAVAQISSMQRSK